MSDLLSFTRAMGKAILIGITGFALALGYVYVINPSEENKEAKVVAPQKQANPAEASYAPKNETVQKQPELKAPPKLPFIEVKGIKYDTLMQQLNSVKLVDVTPAFFHYEWNHSPATFSYYIPTFQTAEGYKSFALTGRYGLGRGLSYNIEYKRFYAPDEVTDKLLFSNLLSGDLDLISWGSKHSNIEGIIQQIELVNTREK